MYQLGEGDNRSSLDVYDVKKKLNNISANSLSLKFNFFAIFKCQFVSGEIFYRNCTT